MNERMATRFCRDDGTVAELRDLFYSDQWQVLEERVRPSTGGVSSQADAQNVWSPVYVDALIERDRDADASATTGVGGLEERVYALQDANWNTTALVAASVSGVAAGTVLNRFIYSAYGEAEVLDAAWSSVTATSVPWTQLFQGLSMTALTGLAYVRHRDFSPRLGRFIERDPLGFEAGDNNWYRFVGNAPTGKLDPTGEIVWVPVIIGIGLGYWWTTNPANAPGPSDPVYPPDDAGFAMGVTGGTLVGSTCVNALAACTTATVSSCTVGSITFGTAHALPHLAGTGLTSLQVESAILGNLATAGGSAIGTHWAWVQIAGNWIQYRVHVLPSGIHVGTYFPVAGPLLNK